MGCTQCRTVVRPASRSTALPRAVRGRAVPGAEVRWTSDRRSGLVVKADLAE